VTVQMVPTRKHATRQLVVSTVDPQTSKDLMFEQLQTRTKNSRKIRFWNSNKNSKVEQRTTWSSCTAEKWHPNIAAVNRSTNLFNDNVMQHFRKILENRQKQMTSDRRMPSSGVWRRVDVVDWTDVSEDRIASNPRHQTGFSPKKNQVVVMLTNRNSQLVDSRWKKGNSPSSEQ
jgi:hypothetical protein